MKVLKLQKKNQLKNGITNARVPGFKATSFQSKKTLPQRVRLRPRGRGGGVEERHPADPGAGLAHTFLLDFQNRIKLITPSFNK